MKRFLISVAVLSIFVCGVFAGEKISAPVVRIIDGDTIVVEINGAEEKIRLAGIDCPETTDGDKIRNDIKLYKVDFGGTEDEAVESVKREGEFAKERITGVISGQSVDLEIVGRDQYNRILAYVYCHNLLYSDTAFDYICINEYFVEEGTALARYSHPKEKQYKEIQAKARSSNRGNWRTMWFMMEE